jgi:hypothetical protein
MQHDAEENKAGNHSSLSGMRSAHLAEGETAATRPEGCRSAVAGVCCPMNGARSDQSNEQNNGQSLKQGMTKST